LTQLAPTLAKRKTVAKFTKFKLLCLQLFSFDQCEAKNMEKVIIISSLRSQESYVA